MVYQVYAGYSVAGRTIKVPQIYMPSLMRCIILAGGPGNEQMLNVIHATTPGTPVTDHDCIAFTNAVDDWIANHYVNIFSEKITVQAVHARSMEQYIAPQDTRNVSYTGTLAGDPMPMDTTLSTEWVTGLTGRENKGMFYPFAPNELSNDGNGRPTIAYAGAVATVMPFLTAQITGNGLEHVVASFVYSTVRPINGAVVRTRWGAQRKRLTQYA